VKKNSKICLFVLTWFTNVTDGQTNRQTDTAWQQRPRLCIASRGNHWVNEWMNEWMNEIDILIPGDRTNIFPSLDKNEVFYFNIETKKMTLLKQCFKLKWMHKCVMSISLNARRFYVSPLSWLIARSKFYFLMTQLRIIFLASQALNHTDSDTSIYRL